MSPHPDRAPADQERGSAGNPDHPAVESAPSVPGGSPGYSRHVDRALRHRFDVIAVGIAVDDDEGNRGVSAAVERQGATVVRLEVRAEPGAKLVVEVDQGQIGRVSISFH